MHYIIIGVIIFGIFIWQVLIFGDTKDKLNVFETIFPEDCDNEIHLNYRSQLTTEETNYVLSVILDSINNYLKKNKGAVSDFHLIKDIVERNCDAKEEEIDTQIPVPLYLGLVGTMTGILIGVGFLVFSGGLDALLGNGVGNGTEGYGIETLLGGVAVAMIASICGILLTIFGSSQAKNAKAKVETNKNAFLSWIHANLLPKLANSTTATLEKLTQNLSEFNTTFAENTHKFQTALSSVTDTYKNLSSTLQEINDMKIDKIAKSNIEVYNKLKNCTDEIGYFSTYLHSVNEYIANVRTLNENLDKNEARTRAIENMGKFFQSEIEQIEYRKKYINKSVGTIDEALHQAVDILKVNSETQISEFKITLGKQQEALQQKLEETNMLYDELRNLTAVKTSINNLENYASGQIIQLGRLAQSIEKLAQMKTSEAVVNSDSSMSRHEKTLIVAGGSLLSVACLIYIIPNLIYWIRLIYNLF